MNYNRGANAAYRAYRANQALTNTCIGTTVGIFGTWNYARRGIVYDVTNDITTRMKAIGVLPRSSQLPSPTSLHDRMSEYLVLNSDQPNNYISWIGSEFSHTNLAHIFFNMYTWSSFAPVLFFLPTRHYAALILGGAIASSATFLYDHRGTQARGLGSSGIVSALLACVTMFVPTSKASIMGVLPMPLWAITGGYFLLDTYFMQAGTQTGIGHSAHVGGGAFGALYYAVFLRKYGGLLGKRY